MTDSFSDTLCLPRGMCKPFVPPSPRIRIFDDVVGWCASCFVVIVPS